MTTDTHSDAFGQRLMALFEAVIELDAAAREARIAEVADTEPALADAVRALLARDAETGALRAHLSAEVEPLLREALPSLASDPQTIGPYAVLRRLGEGGMGRVYLARRSDSPVAQNVAIKLIRSDRVSPGLLDRFEAERRHLAALDHPGICRFIDAASLADGTPYVVMEAVEGVPIIEYCAQRELGVDARLKLLRKLLAAVAHAHDRLLVHRDIKPHNVLVTNDGEPKLLDFGIAKSIEAEHASQTRTAERFFTPNASAPEQLLGGAFGVGCDVYALGALAYELLSGHLPFDFDGLRAAEIERLILQVAPPLMSERAPTARARELRGDLDAIVATCLRKSPAERYANVSALDNDLARYLEGRPVEARAPSWIYRATLFVRRHRVSVALSGALTLAILGSAATLAVQAFELREQRNLALVERDRALRVVEILESAFRNADPARTSGDTVTARQILDAAVPSINALEADQPELFVRLAATLARVELDLTESLRAADWTERGLKASNAARQVPDEVMIPLLLSGAIGMAREGNAAVAESYLARLRDLGADKAPEFALAHARTLATRSRHEEAVSLMRNTVEELDSRGFGPDSSIANETRWLISHCLGTLSRYQESIDNLKTTLRWQLQSLAEDHPWVLRSRVQMLNHMSSLAASPEIAEQLRELIALTREKQGERNMDVALARGILGGTLHRLDRIEQSIVEYRAATEVSDEIRGAEHVGSITLSLSYATVLLQEGSKPSLEEARSLLELRYEILRRRFKPLAPITLYAQSLLAKVLLKLNRSDRTLELLADPTYTEAHTLRSAWNLRAQLSALDAALAVPACSEETRSRSMTCQRIRQRQLNIERALATAGLRVR
ncbi:protein kinase [Aquimonas sp.]|jgi:hypothetical protein|uniref:protein kinase domain-containing protein n=1 Tax=Aquimonas sp. TaxID=1872588 RepID=UPI0037C131E5